MKFNVSRLVTRETQHILKIFKEEEQRDKERGIIEPMRDGAAEGSYTCAI